MRILYLTPQFPPEVGGVSTGLYHLVEAIYKYTHEISVVVAKGNAVASRGGFPYSVSVFPLPNSYSPDAMSHPVTKQFRDFLDMWSPDIVHIHFVGRWAELALILKRQYGYNYKVVVSCQGSDIHQLATRPIEQQLSVQRVLRQADEVICCSDSLLTYVMSKVPSANVKMIPNGINLDEIDLDKPYKSELPYLFACGRFVEVKGFDRLIAAYSRFPKESPPLVIAGSGSLHEQLLMLVKQYHLDQKVSFVGELPRLEIIERMRRGYCFLHAARNEGFPLVILEAMACGIPIICTPVGGVNEIILNGFNGLLAEPEMFFEAFTQLTTDEQYRTLIRRQAIESVQQYSIHQVSPRYARIYGLL